MIYRVLEYLLEVTDHLLIEQSCFMHIHQHLHDDFFPSVWRNVEHHNVESVNIFSLAVTYGRLYLIPTLLDGGLDPDRFPTLWRFEDPLARHHLDHYSKWATPASFIASYQPFTEESLKALQRLIQQQSAGSLGPFKEPYVQTMVALCSAPGWHNKTEMPLLQKAVDYILERPVKLDVLSEWLRAALILNPSAFLRILHFGYPVDSKILAETALMIRCTSLDGQTATKQHLEALDSLSAAGFPEMLSTDRLKSMLSKKKSWPFLFHY